RSRHASCWCSRRRRAHTRCPRGCAAARRQGETGEQEQRGQRNEFVSHRFIPFALSDTKSLRKHSYRISGHASPLQFVCRFFTLQGEKTTHKSDKVPCCRR